MKVENETIEHYLYLIIIKLAILSALNAIKCVFKIHAAYKNSLKKRYRAKDIEAAHPKQNPSGSSQK